MFEFLGIFVFIFMMILLISIMGAIFIFVIDKVVEFICKLLKINLVDESNK